MFVTSVCTGCSTISRTPTAAARWYTTSQRCTSSLTTDDFRTESTTRWKSRRSRRWATFRSEPVERSSRTKTSHPCSSRSSARCEPMKPAPPVISALRPGASALIAPDPRRRLLRRCQQASGWGNRPLLREYFQAMRSRHAPWLAVLTLTAAGVAAAAGYGLTAPKRYHATAQILVAPVSPSDPTFAGIGVLRDTGGRRTAAASVAALVRTPQIRLAAQAAAPASSSSPNVPLLIGIGAGIGAGAGLLVALAALGLRRGRRPQPGEHGPRLSDRELEELGDRLEARLVRREAGL